jgi:hypothetical protein
MKWTLAAMTSEPESPSVGPQVPSPQSPPDVPEETPPSAVFLRAVGAALVVLGVTTGIMALINGTSLDRPAEFWRLVDLSATGLGASAFAFGLASIVQNVARIARKP